MAKQASSSVYDYVIIGSGFGGSVSALRLSEKGYSTLVLERGKRFRDQDFAKSSWNIFRYLWLPALRCFGILQISPFKDVVVLHGSGVGGGSLGYANVLMQPSDELFSNPSWKHLADWKPLLLPHYDTARFMLGVTTNPCQWPADQTLREISSELGTEATFRPTTVGTFFGRPGDEGKVVPDPFFGGEGPERRACIQCGGCMVGCRHNAKNTLEKNYLYFAEKFGTEILSECEVRDVRPLNEAQADGARYEVIYRSTTAIMVRPQRVVRARNVIFSAGSLGTQRLLFRCRDITRSLSRLSRQLGSMVRTNSESLLGSSARDTKVNYSEGIAITSMTYLDPVTTVEPVRYPAGSSLMRFLSGPLVIDGVDGFGRRLFWTLGHIVRRPLDFLKTHVLPGWAQRTTILLVMQTEDNHLHMGLGRHPLTLYRRNLISLTDSRHKIPSKIEIGHHVTRRFAAKTGGIAAGSVTESLFNTPMTAHILGGCPFGRDAEEGVVGLDCQVHNYPGLFVVDGSIMPANPGVNPSLTITALAEYAMEQVPVKPGASARASIGKFRRTIM